LPVALSLNATFIVIEELPAKAPPQKRAALETLRICVIVGSTSSVFVPAFPALAGRAAGTFVQICLSSSASARP
jgi:hypothetical protein